MVYRGRVDHGVVVFEGGSCLPEGTTVEIVSVQPKVSAEQADQLYRLHELATPSGVPDLAMNIDHYLYGHPKVDDAQS